MMEINELFCWHQQLYIYFNFRNPATKVDYCIERMDGGSVGDLLPPSDAQLKNATGHDLTKFKDTSSSTDVSFKINFFVT